MNIDDSRCPSSALNGSASLNHAAQVSLPRHSRTATAISEAGYQSGIRSILRHSGTSFTRHSSEDVGPHISRFSAARASAICGRLAVEFSKWPRKSW